jgi:hypothetical protein
MTSWPRRSREPWKRAHPFGNRAVDCPGSAGRSRVQSVFGRGRSTRLSRLPAAREALEAPSPTRPTWRFRRV